MALKTIDPAEILEFIPTSERKDPSPTTVFYGKMSKREYDAYLNSLTELKKNKVVSHHEKASEFLFKKCLRAKNAIFIKNGYVDGVFVKEIKDLDAAVNFLLGIGDIEAANEIEQVMRGNSEITEDEEKNSDGQ